MNNRIIELLQNYNDDNRRKEELDLLDLKELNGEELLSWYNIRGIIDFNGQKIEQAICYFQKGLELFPEEPSLLLNMALIKEELGKHEEMVEFFKKIFNSLDKELNILGPRNVLYIVRLCYLWDKYEWGIKFLQPIFEIYRKSGFSEDMYNKLNNIPFYGETFSNLALFSFLNEQPDIANSELEDAKSTLNLLITPYEVTWKCIQNNDWEGIEKILQMQLEEWEKKTPEEKEKEPIGYTATRIAILKARKTAKYQKALKIIEDVRLKKNDFPWLEDILLLGKIEIAQKFGKNTEKNTLLDKFWKRQPRLFEPPHVINFGFIKIQEILKQEYRKNKISNEFLGS